MISGTRLLIKNMNVIIRLKNLPWTANAMDIRSFFKGLSIPEGGVHIVGGENGDAFIAFRYAQYDFNGTNMMLFILHIKRNY